MKSAFLFGMMGCFEIIMYLYLLKNKEIQIGNRAIESDRKNKKEVDPGEKCRQGFASVWG